MKTLVVFYSRTGVTKKIALQIASELGADTEELIDTDARLGAWGYLKSGREAIQKKLAVLQSQKYQPSEYDLLIIGTPTWAAAMACPLRTYLTVNQGRIKNVAFFATHGSSGGENAIRQMAKLSGLESRAELALTTREVLKDTAAEKVQSFLARLK